ncbi:MAG: hypothetical protein ACYDHM_14230 [Acidiferrobacterales bacterium]
MITWIRLWPFLALPGVLMIAMGAVVGVPVGGHEIGGAAVRNWCIIHLLLNWLPGGARNQLAAWIGRTDALHRWALYLLISVNVNALLLPLFFGLGAVIQRLQAWGARQDLELKSTAVRRGGRPPV